MDAWQTLKGAWQVLIVIFSILISIGIFQINLISVKVPPTWAVPAALVLILFCSWIALAVSLIKIYKLTKALQNHAPLFIEGVPIQGLTAHVLKRAGKSKNAVHLKTLELSVSVIGIGACRDAAVRWHLAGVNTTDTNLTNLQISISGESLTPLKELQCVVYDLSKDPQRKIGLHPILVSEDSTNKDLILPFLSPGIKPYEQFDIELGYCWPSIVEVRKDYWFIDPMNHAPQVETIRFKLATADPFIKAVYAFQFNAITKEAQFRGSVPILQNTNEQKVIYEIEKPSPHLFYVFIFEGTTI